MRRRRRGKEERREDAGREGESERKGEIMRYINEYERGKKKKEKRVCNV